MESHPSQIFVCNTLDNCLGSGCLSGVKFINVNHPYNTRYFSFFSLFFFYLLSFFLSYDKGNVFVVFNKGLFCLFSLAQYHCIVSTPSSSINKIKMSNQIIQTLPSHLHAPLNCHFHISLRKETLSGTKYSSSEKRATRRSIFDF